MNVKKAVFVFDGDAIPDGFKMPRRSTTGSAGYDFFLNGDSFDLAPGDSIVIDTHIKIKMRPDLCLMMYPRSGHGFKYGIRLANTVGIIDSDYYSDVPGKGVIKIKLVNGGNNMVHIESGDAIAQGIITHFFVTDDDSATGDRNGEGFGSTDGKH